MIHVELTALVVPIAKPVAPSGIEHWAKWLLEGCGVDVAGTESVIAELRLAERDAVAAQIAAVDQEAQALAERRQALVAQLRGGELAHTYGDSGDVLDSAIR